MKKTWTIHQLERKAEDGFVVNVHWRYSISDTDENGKLLYADTYSVASFAQDEEAEDYIPYEDLTEDIVIDWVKNSLGEEQFEQINISLVQQIENQKNPPIKTGLPWQE